MCGIAGIWNYKSGQPVEPALLRHITGLLSHRGPDGEGFYTVTNLPVGSYTVAVEQKGFKKAVQTDNVLAADTRLTVNVMCVSACSGLRSGTERLG